MPTYGAYKGNEGMMSMWSRACHRLTRGFCVALVFLAGVSDAAAQVDLTQIHYLWRNDDGPELGLDVGDGADGALAPTGTFNFNTDTSGARVFADGIAYRMDASTATGTSVDRFSGADTLSNGIAAGDEVLLINLQGVAGDTADVGNYEFLEVQSVTASTLTFTTTITNSYDGITFTDQMVMVQRVPNYTTVTLDFTDVLTASGWDGLTTTPVGAAGYLTGIVVFRATGAVSVDGGTSIGVDGLGYNRGGAGGSDSGGINGESYDGTVGSGGDDTIDGANGGNPGTDGGGGSSNYDANSPAGTRGGGGGGGNTDAGTSGDGAGGAGGGGYGGGGGGSDGGFTGGTGGLGGNSGVSGGGMGGDNKDAGGGGDAPNDGGLPAGGGCTGPALGGSGATTGEGGATECGGATSSGVGAGGGGGGGLYGTAALTQLFFGSGGGGGGSHDQPTMVPGGVGGGGGGIVYISADTVTITGNVTSNGTMGVGVGSREGGGGGGAGGSILFEANSATVGISLVTATGAAGGDAGNPGGGGGEGGVGRIHIGANTITGTTGPLADTSGTPNNGGATWAAAQDAPLCPLAKETIRRLRFEVSNEGGTSSGPVTYQLQVAETATCGSGTYTAVPTDTSGHWQVVGSTFITDGEATMNISPGLFDEATTFVAGELKDAGNTTGGITLNGDEFTEIEFALQATTNATDSGSYCFRLYDTTGVTPLDTYTVYAEACLADAATLTLADHDAGQIGDQFAAASPVTSELFRFKLTRTGAATVDNIRVHFSTTGGVANGDVSSGELWRDVNNDGVINGGDTSVQLGVTPRTSRVISTRMQMR